MNIVKRKGTHFWVPLGVYTLHSRNYTAFLGGNTKSNWDYKKTVFAGVAVAYSDLCRDCGTIIRTYIKENTDKNWNKR